MYAYARLCVKQDTNDTTGGREKLIAFCLRHLCWEAVLFENELIVNVYCKL